MTTLRDYQHRGLALVQEYWAAGAGGVILQAPTGAGKTVMFGKLIADAVAAGKRVIVLVHRDHLVRQTAHRLRVDWGLPERTIGAFYSRTRQRRTAQASRQVLVAMCQTLWHPANRGWVDDFHQRFDLLVVDEAHHSASPCSLWLLAKLDVPQRLGVTATPARAVEYGEAQLTTSEDLALASAYAQRFGQSRPLLEGDTVTAKRELPLLAAGWEALVRSRDYGARIRDLTAAGTLAPLRWVEPGESADWHGSADSATCGRWSIEAMHRIMDWIVADGRRTPARSIRGRRGLCFLYRRKECQDFQPVLRERGLSSAVLTQETSARERERILQRFATGRTDVLLTCTVLTEGFDCPSADYLIHGRTTGSPILASQITGRITRPYPPGHPHHGRHKVVYDAAHIRGIHGDYDSPALEDMYGLDVVLTNVSQEEQQGKIRSESKGAGERKKREPRPVQRLEPRRLEEWQPVQLNRAKPTGATEDLHVKSFQFGPQLEIFPDYSHRPRRRR